MSVLLLLAAACGEPRAAPVPLPPLLDAARSGEVATLRALLDRGEGAEARDGNGRTALHWAAIGGSEQALELLLARGADVDARAQLGMTPLHWAALAGKAGAADLLLRRGADVRSQNVYGMTPLHEAGTPEVARVLLTRGAKVADADRRGMTPLHMARTGRVARVLLDAGADPFARAANGRRPMDMAAAGEREPGRIMVYAARASARLRGDRGAMALELRNVSDRAEGPIVIDAESPGCDVELSPPRLARLDPGQIFPVILGFVRRPGPPAGEHPLRLTVTSAGKPAVALELRVDTSPGETPEDRGLVRVGGATLRRAPSRLQLLAFAAVPLLLSALWLLGRRRPPPPASSPGG